MVSVYCTNISKNNINCFLQNERMTCNTALPFGWTS